MSKTREDLEWEFAKLMHGKSTATVIMVLGSMTGHAIRCLPKDQQAHIVAEFCKALAEDVATGEQHLPEQVN